MITLRPALPVDCGLLSQWDQEEHVVASDPNDDWNWTEELHRRPAWREQLIAESEGIPIGFLQIIDPAQEDSHYWGDISGGKRAIDLWIGSSEHLGRGFGTEMMTLALNKCFSDPAVHEVLVDPLHDNHGAIRFYRRLGFRFRENRYFGADYCAVHSIARDDWIKRFISQAE